LQAKKVDINFDADDFFSSFDPVPEKKAPVEKKKMPSPKAAADIVVDEKTTTPPVVETKEEK
jgi:hypothetical protein